MTENNLQQSQIIDGGIALPNRTGLALGTFYQTADHVYLLLPGPLSELKPMFIEQARPLLEQNFPSEEMLISKVLRFYGIGESQLVTELKDLIETQINPTIAPYAKSSTSNINLSNEVQKSFEDAQNWAGQHDETYLSVASVFLALLFNRSYISKELVRTFNLNKDACYKAEL